MAHYPADAAGDKEAEMAETGNGSGISPILLDLKQDLMKGFIEDTFEFAGKKFRMHTLSDGEVSWRDKYVSMASNMALISSLKAPTLSVAISHINDQPVATLWPLPGDQKLKEFMENNPEDSRDYFREKMYHYLEELPDAAVSELYRFYVSLDERRAKVIENLKNSSKGTKSSASSSTSSPVAGPPAVEEAAAAAAQTPGGSFSG